MAVDMCDVRTVRWLAKKRKVQKDLPDSNGITPLQLAVIKKNSGIVDILLSAGVDPNQPVSLAIKRFAITPDKVEEERRHLVRLEERRDAAWLEKLKTHWELGWEDVYHETTTSKKKRGMSWGVWDSLTYEDGQARAPTKAMRDEAKRDEELSKGKGKVREEDDGDDNRVGIEKGNEKDAENENGKEQEKGIDRD